MKTLLIFSHTFFADSKVNKALLEAAKSLPNLTIHNLSTTYPNGVIDPEAEIALLKQNERIIFQFPLFWFSTPSIMKEWQDIVLSKIHYGSEKGLFVGKKFRIITTAGGDESSYDGHHGYSLETLLSPITHAFAYSGCEILPSYCVYRANANNLPLEQYLGLLG